jgi:hypothetical protein
VTWAYGYDALERLVSVRRNGALITTLLAFSGACCSDAQVTGAGRAPLQSDTVLISERAYPVLNEVLRAAVNHIRGYSAHDPEIAGARVTLMGRVSESFPQSSYPKYTGRLSDSWLQQVLLDSLVDSICWEQVSWNCPSDEITFRIVLEEPANYGLDSARTSVDILELAKPGSHRDSEGTARHEILACFLEWSGRGWIVTEFRSRGFTR